MFPLHGINSRLGVGGPIADNKLSIAGVRDLPSGSQGGAVNDDGNGGILPKERQLGRGCCNCVKDLLSPGCVTLKGKIDKAWAIVLTNFLYLQLAPKGRVTGHEVGEKTALFQVAVFVTCPFVRFINAVQ